MKSSRYNIVVPFGEQHLVVHNLLTEQGFMLDRSHQPRVATILSKPAAVDPDDQLVARLMQAGCLIGPETDEAKMIAGKRQQFLDSNRDCLQLTIIPTYQCNFKCVYCWEETADTGDAMPVDAQMRLLRYIEERLPQVSSLNIDWFGGEPLMAFHVVKNLSRSIDAMCKAHHIPYFCSMTTNGYLLTEERFRFLLRHHTRFFQVTIDGPAELHNLQRPLKPGRKAAPGTVNPRGTFERIVENIRTIRDNVQGRFEFLVRVNVTGKTAEHMDEILAFFRDEFADDWRFRLYMQGVEEHDGLRAEEMAGSFLESGDSTVDRAFDRCIEDNVRVSTLRIDSPGDLMCKARHENAYFVNSDGEFYKCDMCMEKNHVTHAGSVSSTGELALNTQNLTAWNAIEPPPYCNACVLQPLCFGLKCPYYNTIQNETRCELFNSHSAANNAVKAFAQQGKYEIVDLA